MSRHEKQFCGCERCRLRPEVEEKSLKEIVEEVGVEEDEKRRFYQEMLRGMMPKTFTKQENDHEGN